MAISDIFAQNNPFQGGNSDLIGQGSDALGASALRKALLGDASPKAHSFPLVQPYWFQTASDGGTGNKRTKLIHNDAFIFWNALNGADFRQNYGYEFVISINNQVHERIVLPINPSNINKTVPVAVVTTVTMKGISEEHNGAPLRPIVVSGTTGVMPLVTFGQPQSNSNGLLDYIFKNTIQQVGSVVNQFNKTVATFTGAPNTQTPLNFKMTDLNNKDSNILRATGYYFIHSLERFLDYYIALKKTKAGKRARLVLQMHKDQEYYDCSLNSYAVNKQAGSIEYNYNVQLTAWKRRAQPVGGRLTVQQTLIQSQADKLNALARIIDGLQQARLLIAKSYGVMQGIRADIDDALLRPMRDTMLAIKDTLNLALTMYDFVTSSKNSFWAGAYNELAAAWNNTMTPTQVQGVNQAIKNAGFSGTSQAGGNSALASATLEQQSSGVADGTVSSTDTASPLKTMFNNPVSQVEVFDSIKLDQMPLGSASQAQINTDLERVRNLGPDDFRTYRDTVANFNASISEALGGGNATFNRINGLPPPKKTFNTLTTDDISLLSSLNDVEMGIDTLINSFTDENGSDQNDYYSFYQNFAVAGGLNFAQNISKFLAPFPYGASLESLALQYLGDSNRWIEIAALNALKAPYIDEVGFQVPLIGTGAGNSVTITVADHLYVGQVVDIASLFQQPSTRKIKQINVLSDNEVIVTLDGDPNLGMYRLQDGAFLHAFLPDTVNSQKLIAIPSEAPVGIPGTLYPQPGVDDLNAIARLAKVDFLLDSSGDIIFTSGGDILLAYGITNLVQAALMKLQTSTGSIIDDPTYGNPAKAGASTAEMDATDVLNDLNAAFADDQRYNGIMAAQVTKSGPTLSIQILVGIANTGKTLPLSTAVPI